VSSRLKILIESTGIKFLRVEFLGKLQRGVKGDESGMEFDRSGRLEGGVCFFLEPLEFRQIGT